MRKIIFLLAGLLALAGLLPLPAAEAAGSYTFAFGGFANKAQATNVDDGSVCGINDSMTSYLFEDLIDCPQMELLDQTLVTSQARADEISLQLDLGSVPPEYREARADYILCGSLYNVGVQRSANSVLVAGGRSEKVRIDAAVRVLDARTGRQLYVATGRGIAASRELGVGIGKLKLIRVGETEFSEECFYKALRQAVKEIALKLKKDI